MTMLATIPAVLGSGYWTLTECSEQGGGLRFIVPREPALIGRTAATTITLNFSSVSKRHAEIHMEDGRPVLTDLGSTNGTFVNGRPAAGTPLADGDVVQFATLIFRVSRPGTAELNATLEETGGAVAAALRQFEQLLGGSGIDPHFQPIVALEDQTIVGQELLVRSHLPELSSAAEILATAARLGQECQLSEVIRRTGALAAARLPACPNLFLNTHPREILNDRFLESLEELRLLVPEQTMTIEVHEAALASREEMRRFRAELDRLDMFLAYDDFGDGQARLDELCEVPPEFLKFDIKLVRGIDQAPAARRSLVRTLVEMTKGLGVTTLAEGVETSAEADACRELGFQLAQGFYFGRPAPVDSDLGRSTSPALMQSISSRRRP